MYVIKCLTNNEWIEFYDPDWYEAYPTGYAQTTADIRRAMPFDTAKQALEFYRSQSKLIPLRPDGLPNRPLTAMSVVVEKIKERHAA